MYEYLMEKSYEAENKAIELYHAGNMNLSKFYKKVSIGFRMKALKLSIKDC